jgi:hypothetical protein
MKFFVSPTAAPVPTSDEIKWGAWALAAVLGLMALAQLFSFEKFIPFLSTLNLPGGEFTAYVGGSLLVITEVSAIPYLLRMELSPLMRMLSIVAGYVAIVGWLVIQVILSVRTPHALNNGLLGASVHLPAGWWAVILLLALGGLAAWVSRNMWPLAVRSSTDAQE